MRDSARPTSCGARGRRARLVVLALLVGLAACSDDTGDPTGEKSSTLDPSTTTSENDPPADGAPSDPAPAGAVIVDVGTEIGVINRELSGIHAKASAESIAADFDDLAPRTHRHVTSAADFLHYDCETGTIDQGSLDYFHGWLDAVAAEGADAILSLSYVPECIARDGQPKGPTTDETEYRRFLDVLLGELVTARAADGRKPLERFELWNEPDVPIDPGAAGSGHGFVGNIDEFVDVLLPHQLAALEAVEEGSDVEVLVGTPAAFSPWPFNTYAETLVDLLVDVNGYDRAFATEAAAVTDGLFEEPHMTPATGRIMDGGGFTWPRRVIDEAAEAGFEFDFVSVHLYPNSPLLGAVGLGEEGPLLLQGRNPFASPEDYARLAELWSAEFPGMELIVSEWSLSAGAEWRHQTCEGAAFNASVLSVMQDSTIDRALFLGRPPAPADAAMRTWALLPETQVSVTVPETHSGVWATAAHGDDRTTVLISQWHSDLAEATSLVLPVRISGLPDGDHVVDVTWLGESDPVQPGTSSAEATSTGDVLDLDPITLDGQSVVRVDIRRPDTDPLPALTTPPVEREPGPCLP